MICRRQPRDFHPLGDLTSQGTCIAVEVGDDVLPRHMTLGVGTGIGVSGERQCPIRRDQGEAVPSVPPGLPDLAAFEHHMLEAQCAQFTAHSKAGLPRADDHN